MNLIPHEFAFGGIFMPPLLVASLLGTIATAITIRLLNRYRLARHFFYPAIGVPGVGGYLYGSYRNIS